MTDAITAVDQEGPVVKQNVIRIARCNFCAKEQQTVKLLISSPNGFGPFPVLICDECVDVCNSIIATWGASQKPAESLAQGAGRRAAAGNKK